MNFFSFHHTIQIRLILQFISSLTLMSVTPFLIVYFSSKVGSVETGFMLMSVIIVSIVGGLLGGMLSDRNGRKKGVLISEAILFGGFSTAACFNSPWIDAPYITFVLFLIIHFFTGVVSPSYQAMIVDISKPEERKSIYALSYWMMNFAAAIGGIIGAFLFKEHRFELFLAIAMTMFISFFVTWFFIKETHVNREPFQPKQERNKSRKGFFRHYSEVFKDKKFVAFSIATLLAISLEEQLTNYIGIRLQATMKAGIELSLGLTSFSFDGLTMLGFLKTENTILVVVLSIFVAKFLSKHSERFILLGGVALYAFGYTVISYSSTPWVLLVFMFLATFGEMAHIPVKQAMLAKMIPDSLRSTYFAFYGLTGYAASMFAGMIIVLGHYVSPIIVTCVFFSMGLVSVTIFSKLTKEKKQEENETIISLAE
jgi:DHA1 family multidrug resistance protein B-like MFS transporter